MEQSGQSVTARCGRVTDRRSFADTYCVCGGQTMFHRGGDRQDRRTPRRGDRIRKLRGTGWTQGVVPLQAWEDVVELGRTGPGLSCCRVWIQIPQAARN